MQNWSTEDFSVDERLTPILSIAPTIINNVTNSLFENNGHKRNSHSEGTGLGTWVGGPKILPKAV